jgi:hypothetical protein
MDRVPPSEHAAGNNTEEVLLIDQSALRSFPFFYLLVYFVPNVHNLVKDSIQLLLRFLVTRLVGRCCLEVPAESKLSLHSHGCLSNHRLSAHDKIIFLEGEKAK